jgi:dTDP-4-dehydrorhamnose reductase
MTDLLVFGGDSLVGSHFREATHHRVTAAGRQDARLTGPAPAAFLRVDLADTGRVREAVRESDAEVVVNFAAFTDVDAAERERPSTPAGAQGTVLRVNAQAPEEMARATRDTGKFLISLSTDFVFDGEQGPYSESSEPAPFSAKLSWYGWTKGEGERRIRAVDPRAAIVRIAYPYRTSFPGKLDFARKIVDAHRRHQLPAFFSDQTITPTWIPDASNALEHLIQARASGTFHVASPEVTTPYRFAKEMLSHLGGSGEGVREGSMAEFLERNGVTPRPRRGGLTCQRIMTEGVPLTSWREGIRRFISEGGAR